MVGVWVLVGVGVELGVGVAVGASGHVGNLKLPIRVFQVNGLLTLKYSFVYQNVQSSAGSKFMLL
jgi:hypothetical protein